ncbi:MAG: ABC transporter permease [Candidatus Limnocylindrales bacterium]|jgi:peptide/nickel transport system permease protein|nr:ABC transporter permease [Candidatus Limnocylindrales bacterium]
MAAGTGVAVVRAAPRASRGLWRDALQRLFRNGPAILGLIFIAIFVIGAILAPYISPYDPTVGVLSNNLKGPSLAHLMGTDLLGRDEFSRVLYGARISLTVGVVAVIFGLIGGTLMGAIAGGAGGYVDGILMRVVDVLLAVPGILLAIGIIAWLGHGEIQIMLAVGVSYSPIFARLLRGSLLALRESDYVIAARSMGASPTRILLRHMLPNALTPLIVQATLAAATAIIDVAGLGFLGLGPGDPRIAEWGEMLTDSSRFLQSAPYLILFPGAAIVISAVGFNLLGDGLREAIDPRLKR